MGSISHYIREIGRGRDGARPLTREHATDLFGKLLDGTVSDLEVGAFCLAMRIKGETPDEMAGFLDATASRSARIPAGDKPLVVLPSYNGARKLPLLTPLLALLVAQRGLPVVIHGTPTESSRVFVSDVLRCLDIAPATQVAAVPNGSVTWLPTQLLCPGLVRLLEVRRAVGLRNSSHSLVKLMNPSAGRAIVVGSYTHPEYAVSMAAVFERVGATGMLLRGTEGEPVADARRLPQMEGFVRGERLLLEAGRKGTLTSLPELPAAIDAPTTAGYIQDVLAGRKSVPESIATQVECILRLATA
ncbi:MAG TPA: DNA-binding protein YbiB [Ramlibacter sp.]|nr:DNA-binding protein YbiB [Ramlibacter sp.]